LFHLDPLITAWEKKKPAYVDFRREQIVWQKPMEGFARLFATLNVTGYMEKLNAPVFDAVMQQKINLADPSVLNDWLKKQPGVNLAKFMQTYNSFGINSQVARQPDYPCLQYRRYTDHRCEWQVCTVSGCSGAPDRGPQ
jgi:thiol:disulfide interchange protein DsbA